MQSHTAYIERIKSSDANLTSLHYGVERAFAPVCAITNIDTYSFGSSLFFHANFMQSNSD